MRSGKVMVHPALAAEVVDEVIAALGVLGALSIRSDAALVAVYSGARGLAEALESEARRAAESPGLLDAMNRRIARRIITDLTKRRKRKRKRAPRGVHGGSDR